MEKSNLYSAFSIVGLVDDDYRKVKKNITGYPVLGTTRDIPEIVAKKSIGLILFAITKVSRKDRDRILDTCKELPVRVILIPDLLKVVSDYLTKQTQEVQNPMSDTWKGRKVLVTGAGGFIGSHLVRRIGRGWRGGARFRALQLARRPRLAARPDA